MTSASTSHTHRALPLAAPVFFLGKSSDLRELARAADGCDPGTPNNVRVAARALVAAELDQLLDLRPFRVARLHHRS